MGTRLKKDTPVERLAKIGPKTSKLLANLGIVTVENLLTHYPTRYEDRREVQTVSKAGEGESVVLHVTLNSIQNIFTRKRKKLTIGKATDDTGEILLVWFNMHYIAKTLKPGGKYAVHGKIGTFEHKKAIIVPEMERLDGLQIHTDRIVPIYPLTKGITQKWLRNRLFLMIHGNEVSKYIVEELPKTLIEKRKLIPKVEAIKEIHFPESQEKLKEAQKRLKYEEIFETLAKRKILSEQWGKGKRGVALEKEINLGEIEPKLPFNLTQDQITATKEIWADIEKTTPMNRLLSGDVGTGKTIVALLASLKALESGANVLYMAPTEILAKQHYQTFTTLLEKIMGKSPVNLVTGTTQEKAESKTSTVYIGTHALLYKDSWTNIGLVIIDEQQRFGVAQRAKLANLAKETTPHMLSMTATPIPRTLALAMFNGLPISRLTEHPHKKRNVKTKVIPKSKWTEIYAWIKQSRAKTFIVCPFIEPSNAGSLANIKSVTEEFEQLQKGELKGVRMGMLHGKLAPQEKEKILAEFAVGKLQVLVATPVVEVGIDIADADVMIIQSAERYGLASLHQLRGRIGRQGNQGYCFLFPTTSAEGAIKRLKILESVDDGLTLAERDLELRGQGDLQGTLQHGFKQFKLAKLQDIDLFNAVQTDLEQLAKETPAIYTQVMNGYLRELEDIAKN